ncbi:hypothetical protein EHQ53_18070 [Leptospira langatensis]|uniref:Arabinofuranosyltransferase n=1 Tax=Leptospira langatensis TaxID=2484983 RepID=A0A5F1ZR90_9LEPT|nr:hypothetical protein EHO57_02310 [Leptospira langatensis]TGL38783.1 hypothetical protein EHQ53_18070 [Leptospira langatensis]
MGSILEFFRRPLPKYLFPIVGLGFAYVIFVNSWVCDDAYITFRTVDNFLNGYGLRWNVQERVQGYTHPLWLFGVSFLSFFKIPVYYSSLILSWICVASLAILLMKRMREKVSSIYETYWILFLLLSSRCFIDYSSSGLENPLSFLLVLLMLQTGLNLQKDFRFRSFFLFSVLASFTYLNRQDAILFAVPFFGSFFFSKIKKPVAFVKTLGIATLGFLPAILWSLFSLLYYGYAFPNTAYAKLNTGISTDILWLYGISYLQNSFRWDLFSSLFILLAVAILPFLYWKKRTGHLCISLGILLYLLYVCSIGGDFMAGRFIALPFVISVFLISDLFSPFLPRLALVFFVAFSVLNQNSLLYVGKDYLRVRNDGEIQDEKGTYFRSTNILRSFSVPDFPAHGWASAGKEFKKKEVKKDVACATLNIGFYGYFAGPERRIVDVFALTDPLLSKLPTVSNWRIGHFARNIPEGYMQSVSNGENLLEDPYLKVYYAKLKLLTESADLFSKERLAEILRENLGENRSLLSHLKTRSDWKGIPEKFHCGLGPGY